MTWGNPIFMIVVITAIWFIPGIVIRRLVEKQLIKKKKLDQEKRIASLYPKNEK